MEQHFKNGRPVNRDDGEPERVPLHLEADKDCAVRSPIWVTHEDLLQAIGHTPDSHMLRPDKKAEILEKLRDPSVKGINKCMFVQYRTSGAYDKS